MHNEQHETGFHHLFSRLEGNLNSSRMPLHCGRLGKIPGREKEFENFFFAQNWCLPVSLCESSCQLCGGGRTQSSIFPFFCKKEKCAIQRP